jgi:ABC-type polysaccharide/polyol phosphate export permease
MRYIYTQGLHSKEQPRTTTPFQSLNPLLHIVCVLCKHLALEDWDHLALLLLVVLLVFAVGGLGSWCWSWSRKLVLVL